MISQLVIAREQWAQILTEVERLAPEEACGLLAGIGDRVVVSIPVTNALHSPVRFRMEPLEQLKAFQRMEAQGWELIGIYHSHPLGQDMPSQTDIDEAYYPETVYVIVSGREGEWHCRGFLIWDGQTREVPILIEE